MGLGLGLGLELGLALLSSLDCRLRASTSRGGERREATMQRRSRSRTRSEAIRWIGLPLRLYEVVLNVSDEKEHAPG